MAYFAVDRLEGKYAVLIGGDGSEHEVARKQLPMGIVESTVLEVALDGHGRPLWGGARLDAAEQQRRLERAQAMLDDLRKADPGGDIVL